MLVQMFTEEGMPAGEQEVPEDVYAAASLVRSWMEAKGCDGLNGLSTKPSKPASVIPTRRYLPTLSDLVDRMSIVQLKALFIPEQRTEYLHERGLIEHDIDLILTEVIKLGERITAADIHAIIGIALTNHLIWINESKARAGGNEQDKLLKLTHSLNGQRNAAKNKLARVDEGRRDFKVDCFAADLVEEFGHLQIF